MRRIKAIYVATGSLLIFTSWLIVVRWQPVGCEVLGFLVSVPPKSLNSIIFYEEGALIHCGEKKLFLVRDGTTMEGNDTRLDELLFGSKKVIRSENYVSDVLLSIPDKSVRVHLGKELKFVYVAKSGSVFATGDSVEEARDLANGVKRRLSPGEDWIRGWWAAE